jgi:hypothetical protein
VPRGRDSARHCHGLKGAPPRPALGLAGLVSGVDIAHRVTPIRQGPPRRHQPAADIDPVRLVDRGNKAAVPVPLDHLAADLDTDYEGLEAARDIVPHPIC